MAAKEIIQVKFEIDGKEITATEKDLRELEKATKELQKNAKKSQVSMKGLGGAFAAVGTAALAAGGAVLAFGKATLDATRELDIAIQKSGVQAEAFQRQAAAAKTVGIEQDKLGDIYKDVNDKLGDFVQTGAGPLKDFFTSIGKQVGVSIDDFKDLSGDQALGLYVSSLEKANVSQAEMAFFMEALASDSTLLAPLLANNAAEMTRLGEAAGTVLSEEQIANAGRLSNAFDTMSNSIQNQLKGAFIDVATEAAAFFGLLDNQAQKVAKARMSELNDNVEDLQASLKALDSGEIDSVSGSFADMNNIDFKNILGFDDITEENAKRLRPIIEAKLEATKQQYLAQADVVGMVNAEVVAQEKLATIAKSGQGLGTGEGAKIKVKDVEAQAKATEDLAASNAKAAAEQEVLNKALADEAIRFERVKESMGLANDFALIHKQELMDLQALLAGGAISAERYADEIRKIATGEDGEDGPFAGLADELTSLETKMKDMKSDAIVGMADSFADMALSGKSNFGEMAASMLKDIAKLIIKTLILRAVMAFINPAAATPVATGAVGGIKSRGQTTLVGENGPELIQPASATRIIPNHAIGGGSGIVQNNTISVTLKEDKGETSAQQAEKISKAITRDLKQMVQGELVNQRRSGNMLNPANVTGGFR